MTHRDVAVILATGGMGLVRAAYSAGKPAYGVGPGNAPCYVDSTADLKKAASDIITGKTFDNGVLCSSPNSVVADQAIDGELRREFKAAGAYFMNAAEMETLAKVLVTPQRLPNPALVGKPAAVIAGTVGLTVPAGTRALIAPLTGVGRDFPLSIEKLAPILSWYVVKDWREGCERCIQILRYGGMGHTMSIHSNNDDVILQFGLKKPAFRICVNTPTTHGSIGLTTGLDPAMTLGCGGWGGNITSDNITPRHLLNIKRLAYEVRPAVTATRPDANAVAVGRTLSGAETPVAQALSGLPGGPDKVRPTGNSAQARPALPKAPVRPVQEGIPADALAARIDQFLASKGYKPVAAPAPATVGNGSVQPADAPADFICEDDVRTAVRAGRKLLIGEKTIVTPAARDLGEAEKVFVQAGWPS
jgi:acetaldehyde dehydrogenase (acetylating)